ncbi:MAG: hypothetical protein IJX13_00470 [Clostridia bacterium]|nr:hypothetical protein [Clostridia bacterium]
MNDKAKHVFALIKGHLDQVIHISSVNRISDRGEKGKFVCPKCCCPMGTRLGDRRQWHFYHVNSKMPCEANIANETALHLLAKQIIAESSQIKIPAYVLDAKQDTNRNSKDQRQNEPYICREEMTFSYSLVKVEERIGKVVADMLLSTNELQLCLEIAATHFVDNDKLTKIKANDISTLEIDVSSFLRKENFKEKEFKKFLLEETEGKKWVYHRREKIFLQELIARNVRYQKNFQERILNVKKIYSPLAERKKATPIYSQTTGLYRKIGCKDGEFPPYCNVPVQHENAFVCERNKWQQSIFYEFIISNKWDKVSAIDVFVYVQKNFWNDLLRDKNNYIPQYYVDPQPDSCLGKAITEYLTKLMEYGFLEKAEVLSFFDEMKIIKRC